MSSKKAKSKKVSQNDLRKMMNEMKTKRTSDNQTRRDAQALLKNPDAYKRALNDRKKLQALIGGTEKRDPAQEQSETKENLIAQSNGVTDIETAKTLKRPYPTKARSIDATAGVKSGKGAKIPKTDPNFGKSQGLLIGNYSSDSDDDAEMKPGEEKESEASSAQGETEKGVDPSLPEGFFDDPEVDAKMRGVETPADAMDREWDDFQKEIQRETGQSEQIVEEEEEDEKVDREIEEIDEQIMHFTRIEKLSDTRDEIKQKLEHNMETNESLASDKNDSDSDDDAIDDMLDWREKDSYL